MIDLGDVSPDMGYICGDSIPSIIRDLKLYLPACSMQEAYSLEQSKCPETDYREVQLALKFIYNRIIKCIVRGGAVL